jgi:nitrilase
MEPLPRFKAAACHVSPIYFDVAATIDKACALIAEAAHCGARLVAFPEAYICSFPVWSGVRAPVENHDFFVRFARSAIASDGAEIARIREAARRCDVVVSMGFNESTPASLGCVYDSNILIDADGSVLNRHRKLVPTFWEKLSWANGDASGLRVVETNLGKIGALICGENTNPLARYALMAEGEQVHIASYSPRWPTHPAGDGGGYDLAAAIRIRSGAHAFEAKCFNVVSSGFFSDAAADLICRGETKARDLIEASPRSVSMILNPGGTVISDTLQNEEGIVYADIDVNQCVVPKQFHDVSGSYNRFDVFDLRVDRRAHAPARFADVEPVSLPSVGSLNSDIVPDTSSAA